MNRNRVFQNPVFLDIETTTCVATYEALSERLKELWDHKAAHLGAKTPEEGRDLFLEKGGLFAEFGRIVAIAIGYISKDGERELLSVKGLANNDERALLTAFKDIITQFETYGTIQLCAHNGKRFDFPYLCKRMTIQRIALPEALNIQGKKPWEIAHLDTIDMWKFGNNESYVSLDLLTAVLDLPSNKDEIKGEDVGEYYYQKGDLTSIMHYCRKDVVALAQVFRRLSFLPLLAKENIQYVE